MIASALLFIALARRPRARGAEEGDVSTAIS